MLDHVSHSQIEMYLRCPRQWFYRYVEGLKIPPSGSLILGGSYHKALEGNFKQKITSRTDLPVSDCLDIFSDAWNTRIKETESIDWQEEKPGDIKDMGVALVKTYRENISPTVQPTLVEEPYVTDISGVKFVLILDLKDIYDIVIDHKTSSKSYTQEDVDRDIQASAISFVLGTPIIFQNHVALKQKVPRIQIVETRRTPADVYWWLEMAMEIIEQMKTGIAPPRPYDWHCSPKWCGYWSICRSECTRKIITL